MYVIVYCGYEGIDKILWAGEDTDEVIAKVKEARRKVAKLSKIHDKYDLWPEGDEWESLSQEAQDAAMAEYDRLQKRYYDILDKWPEPWHYLSLAGDGQDTDRVCVMKMQDEWGFKCVCGELDVSPSHSWYY